MPEIDKLYGHYEGSVTNREDPNNWGRVKLKIPGLIEPESPMWVQPVGVPGGGFADRGQYEPPAVGANVVVFFIQGDRQEPRYMPGAWGAPGGVNDVPSGAAVEGEKRQNAVTEDEEWRIERDSRSEAQVLRIKHKSSGAEIVIRGTDRIEIGRSDADEALILGTTYRDDETDFLQFFWGVLETLVASMDSATTLGDIIAAGTVADGSMGSYGHQIKDTASAYLSDKAFTVE